MIVPFLEKNKKFFLYNILKEVLQKGIMKNFISVLSAESLDKKLNHFIFLKSIQWFELILFAGIVQQMLLRPFHLLLIL